RDGEAGGVVQADQAVGAGEDALARQFHRQGFQLDGVFADHVVLQPRVGLDRRAQGQVGRKGVVDVGDALGGRVVGDLFGGGEPADPAGVDLDVADLAVVDQVAGHVGVVTPLSDGEGEGGI